MPHRFRQNDKTTKLKVGTKNKKIGYVANSDYTKYKLTSSASELQNKIPDTAKGSYLFYLERYVEIQFPIGRIIKWTGNKINILNENLVH